MVKYKYWYKTLQMQMVSNTENDKGREKILEEMRAQTHHKLVNK